MQEKRNKELLQKAYSRWDETRGGSVDEWIALVDDNISFGSLAEGADPDAFTTRLEGKQSLMRYFEGLTSNWTMLHHTIERYVAEGDQVVAIGSCAWKYNKTGKIVETPIVNVWRFKDGKAVSYYEFYDTAKMLAATAP
jgi:ketosteroid isomerase-like protein